jgi:hypothetical protein
MVGDPLRRQRFDSECWQTFRQAQSKALRFDRFRPIDVETIQGICSRLAAAEHERSRLYQESSEKIDDQ